MQMGAERRALPLDGVDEEGLGEGGAYNVWYQEETEPISPPRYRSMSGEGAAAAPASASAGATGRQQPQRQQQRQQERRQRRQRQQQRQQRQQPTDGAAAAAVAPALVASAPDLREAPPANYGSLSSSSVAYRSFAAGSQSLVCDGGRAAAIAAAASHAFPAQLLTLAALAPPPLCVAEGMKQANAHVWHL